MRLVRLSEIKGDEIVAKPIIDIDERRLISQGARIKKSYINKLVEKGITSVYIEDDISEGVFIEDVLCDETRLKAKKVISEELSRYLNKREIDFSRIHKTVEVILDELLSKSIDLVSLKDLRLHDEYTFAHSVNVCILTVILATKLGYARDKINKIAIGAMLHDFGKILIPPEILNKKEPLSHSDLEEIQKHPMYAYSAFKDSTELSATSKVTILMHHELLDGTGYPLKIKDEKIHYSAKICAVCDVFDAMTSDKVYRNALNTSDAVEYLIAWAGKRYDRFFVEQFIQNIPIFPPGTIVCLSNGLMAIVIKNNPQNVLRPVIRMIYNPKTRTKYNKNYEVNLMEELSINIIKEIVIPTEMLER